MSYYPNLKPFIIRIYPDLEMHKEIENRLVDAIESVKGEIKAYESYNYLDEQR